MGFIAHWEDVSGRSRSVGHIDAVWSDLGGAVGTRDVGLSRIEVAPGRWSTPAHVEAGEEEIFFVLAGSGLSWQDGSVYEVGAGDCLVHLPGREAHTLRAGNEGLDVLAFGQRVWHGNTHLPRAGVSWMTPAYVDATTISFPQGRHPFHREAEAGEPEVGAPEPRRPSIVSVDAADAIRWGKGERVRATRRNLGRAAGSERTGLQHAVVEPGHYGQVPHCHSSEEEILVVLDGEGTLELGDEEHAVRRGSVVGRPPGTGVAHAFRAGPNGLTYLAYGTRDGRDLCYYPRSGKVSFRGIGLIGRFEPLDYWQGET
jgi:uncharacterized cupin superfamily protein